MGIIFPQGKWIAVDNKTPWKFIFWNFQIYRTLFCLLTLLVRYLLKSLRYLHLPNVENITNQEPTSQECLTASDSVWQRTDFQSVEAISIIIVLDSRLLVKRSVVKWSDWSFLYCLESHLGCRGCRVFKRQFMGSMVSIYLHCNYLAETTQYIWRP